MDRFTFDLCYCEEPPSKEFIQWAPKWWYRVYGISIIKGELPNKDKWLVSGWLINQNEISVIIPKFLQNKDIQILFKLNGHFIILIYLNKQDTLQIYRDRIGSFPIAYVKDNNKIIFSIWLNNTIYFSKISSKVSNMLLPQWIVFRKTFAPYTPFQDVITISAEESLTIKNGQIYKQYYPLEYPKKTKLNNIKKAKAVLAEKLKKSIKKRLISSNSNKPAVLLSGGLDSSLIVALAKEVYNGDLTTLFVNFKENSRDYSLYACKVAKKFNTYHDIIEISPEIFLKYWPKTIALLQTPVPMPCHVALSFAFQYLRNKGIDFVISGDGADTVFGGSFWPHLLLLARLNRILPNNFKKFLKKIKFKTPTESFIKRIASMTLEALTTPLSDYPHVTSALISEREGDLVFQHGLWKKGVELRKSFAKGEFFKGLYSYLLLHGIPEDIGTITRLALTNNLFVTYPFLDFDFVKSAMLLSNRLRYNFLTPKIVLKNIALKYFSKNFINKPKEGFGVPLGKWFTQKKFEPLLKLPLEARSLKRGWWKEQYLRPIIEDHIKGFNTTDYSAEAIPWIVVNLELWARICIEGDSPDLYINIGGGI